MEELQNVDAIGISKPEEEFNTLGDSGKDSFAAAGGGGEENLPPGHKDELLASQCVDCNAGGIGDVGEEKHDSLDVEGNEAGDVTSRNGSEHVQEDGGGECACCLFWSLLLVNIMVGLMRIMS